MFVGESRSPFFPAITMPHLAGLELPKIRRVTLEQPKEDPLDDLEGRVREALKGCKKLQSLSSGNRVAIAVGSRGIAEICKVVKTVVDYLKQEALYPFIVPAMGSHGGGTAEGQINVLRKLGIDEENMGCEVRSSMETVDYGLISPGIRCHFDENAAHSDGIVLINRVKAHTSFPRDIESGLVKLIAVGLGKAEGARAVHHTGPRGLEVVLPKLAEKALHHAPISAGLALIENSNKQLCHIEGVEPEVIFETDKRLLKQAKSLMPRMPFEQLDALIVEEFGKDVSGSGLDPFVTGRTDIRGVENPKKPFIHKIAGLRLTEATDGNGMGTGMLDYLPQKTANQLDLQAMYMNSVSATILEKAFIPIVLANEREVVQALTATCWQQDSNSIRLAQIGSTLKLNEMFLTEPLFKEALERSVVLSHSETENFRFDENGNLLNKLI